MKLDLVVPVADEVPAIKQDLAVTRARVDEHEGEINGLRERVHEDANELARVSGLVANGGQRH